MVSEIICFNVLCHCKGSKTYNREESRLIHYEYRGEGGELKKPNIFTGFLGLCSIHDVCSALIHGLSAAFLKTFLCKMFFHFKLRYYEQTKI